MSEQQKKLAKSKVRDQPISQSNTVAFVFKLLTDGKSQIASRYGVVPLREKLFSEESKV
jgi:hypothetical protein